MPAGGGGRRLRHAFPLVEAKLHPPAPRAGTFPRERLLRRLRSEPRPPVVAVVAPAGHGKTLVLAGWSALEDRPVAWLTLDEYDNDPTILLTYLGAAIDRLVPVPPSYAAAIATAGGRMLATAVPGLAKAIESIGEPAVLVLDDLDRLTDPTGLDALASLIEHLPDGFQVAFSSRSDPGLPLARLRAAGDLLEIRRDDLRFDTAETSELAASMGVSLAPGRAAALTEETGGWAAALRLAIASTGGDRPDGTSAVDASAHDGDIADYLRAEVLSRLDERDRSLLVETSILEIVEPDVATAITGTVDARERLRTLSRAHQLLGRVAGEAETYRFHALLRDHLRAELELRGPVGAELLHRRAADWYRSTGRVDLAIDHALLGGDRDGAANLVTTTALATMYGGRGTSVIRWLDALGRPVVERHPPLMIIAAWVYALNGRPEEADAYLDIAGRSSWTLPPGDGSASFASSLAMLRAVSARSGPDAVLADARFAAAAEPAGSTWRPIALMLLGGAHLIHGDPGAARSAWVGAVDASAVTRAGGIYPRARLASMALASGDWAEAARLDAENHAVLAQSGMAQLPPAVAVHAVSARLALRRGDPGGAREALVRAQLLRPLLTWAQPWFAVDSLLELTHAYTQAMDHAGARSALTQAEQILRRRPGIGVLGDAVAEARRKASASTDELGGASALTPAELRLLPYLSTYLTFESMAERLGLSRHTVKSQALSIYGKLGASTRAEAVEHATEIGLVEPFPALAVRSGDRD